MGQCRPLFLLSRSCCQFTGSCYAWFKHVQTCVEEASGLKSRLELRRPCAMYKTEAPSPPHWVTQCSRMRPVTISVAASIEPAASLHLGSAAGLDAVRARGCLVVGNAWTGQLQQAISCQSSIAVDSGSNPHPVQQLCFRDWGTVLNIGHYR